MCEFVTQDHVLNSGIRRQLDAFRSGFNTVFPMDKLGSFSPEEVSKLTKSYSQLTKYRGDNAQQ